MKQGTKIEIEELEKLRSILCDECNSLEQELRQYEDECNSLEQELRQYEEEIEGIDIKISRLKQLYQRPTRKE